MSNAYPNSYAVAAESSPAERSQFLRRTYAHLAGAILAFIGVEAALLASPLAPAMMKFMSGGTIAMLVVFGLFMGASWLAQSWAQSSVSKGMQYAGLGLYVVAQAVIFVPILSYTIFMIKEPNLVAMAGMITLGLFFGLTAVVVLTKKDFSFMGGALKVGSFVILAALVASMIFGFGVGILLSTAVILLAAGQILYQTSNMYNRYSTDQYVAAALGLFASIAVMFMYILNILLGARRN